MGNTVPPPVPTFREALAFWLRLGLIGFGGPAGQIAIMHEYLVDRKRWISNSRFMHALNYCMLLPGPEAQQLAVYTGWMLHGTRGGMAAGVLFVLPSAFILLALSVLYVQYGQLPAVQSVLDFLKPAVLALVALALVRIAGKSLQSFLHYLVAVAAFVAIYFGRTPFPFIIVGAILTGIAFQAAYKSQSNPENGQTPASADPESSFLINADTPLAESGFSMKRLFRQLAVAGLLWSLPLGLIYVLSQHFEFWKKLCLFFTQAALVTFGGAYAVLPYVAQVSVEKLGWLTFAQMVDGLALGETTPGPLIMVLAFVGFMAGFHQFGGSLAAATAGLWATVFYTFLPSFLFIFAGAPIIERTRANPAVRSVLSFATAAVAGVILSLLLYLGQAVLAPHPPQVQWTPLAWTLLSLVALRFFKINLMVWISISVAAGLLKYAILPNL